MIRRWRDRNAYEQVHLLLAGSLVVVAVALVAATVFWLLLWAWA